MNSRGPETVAIMQPYLFPYLGYFQLARSVDEFWLLDNVNFIQQGWMNRNRLLNEGKEVMFTVPVNKHPRIDLIMNKKLADNAIRVLQRLQKSLLQAYAKAPYAKQAAQLVAKLGNFVSVSAKPADFTDATEFALRETFDMIGVRTPIRRISSLQLTANLKGQDRIIAACKAIGARRYVNMIGGRELYDHQAFSQSGLALWFLDPLLVPYQQGMSAFTPGLSVLDAIAHVASRDFHVLLDGARLISGQDLAGL